MRKQQVANSKYKIRDTSGFNPAEFEAKWPFDSAQGKQVYDHQTIEKKWRENWKSAGTYEPDMVNSRKPFDSAQGKPFYNLMMFPYPSAEGLHVGNMYAFCGSDIFGRYMRMKGYDVFEPMGLDGFGIHSENYAMKIGKHPAELSKITEENFYRQLNLIGNGFAWKQKLETYDPNYYRWTQWIFVRLFKAGLAYRGEGEVNWCPSCLTVLADEQAVKKSEVKVRSQDSGVGEEVSVCERCGTEVVKKKLKQWYFRITNYAQRLLDGLDKIDWSEKVKVAQRNWIGKSDGAKIVFHIDIDKQYLVSVFTTRADTLLGVTYIALAVDHELVTTILDKAKGPNKQAIRDFLDYSLKDKNSKLKVKSDEQKNGVFSGFYARHPISGEKIPVYLADYILTGYGTGAVMGVPAHDARDWEFAKKYGIEIKTVIVPAGPVTTFPSVSARLSKSGVDQKSNPDLRAAGSLSSRATRPYDISREAFTGYGKLVDSGKYDGLASDAAAETITADLSKKGLGAKAVSWHLRDWIISRQRYWGPPIPMIFCESCAKAGKSWFTRKSNKSYKTNLTNRTNNSDWDSAGWYPVPEEDLPVLLPYVEKFRPTGSGKSPLAEDPSFTRVKCPECGAIAKRETDVSDTFLDSSWYFLRYPSVKSVSQYVGKVSSLGVSVRSVSTDGTDITDNTDNTDNTDSTEHTDSTENLPWDLEITRRWLPVDMYIGGAEHAVLHLLYSRFITQAFYDLGMVDFDEPFTKFRAHGLLIHDGAKMSKSKGNVVVPDDYIAKYGADTLRAYLMFCGRYSDGGDFRDEGIEGMHRFLKRVWKLSRSVSQWVPTSSSQTRLRGASGESVNQCVGMVGKVGMSVESVESVKSVGSVASVQSVQSVKSVRSVNTDNTEVTDTTDSLYMMHRTIKKVTEDIEALSYNTAIAALMEWVNFLEKKVVNSSPVRQAQGELLMVNRDEKTKKSEATMNDKLLTINEIEILLKLLAPFAPYMTEELWQKFFSQKGARSFASLRMTRGEGDFNSIHLSKWPVFDPVLATSEKVTLVVEVNGKVRERIVVNRGISQDEAEKMALELANVSKYVGGGEVRKVIYIQDKLINFVLATRA